jgi:hypothetical protein
VECPENDNRFRREFLPVYIYCQNGGGAKTNGVDPRIRSERRGFRVGAGALLLKIHIGATTVLAAGKVQDRRQNDSAHPAAYGRATAPRLIKMWIGYHDGKRCRVRLTGANREFSFHHV